MSADDGAIDHPLFYVRVIGEVHQHAFPDTLVAPTSKTLVDRVPSAIVSRQKPPGSTAAVHPEHAFNKSAALRFITDVSIWVTSQEVPYLRPLLIWQSHRCHETSLSSFKKCQHSLAS